MLTTVACISEELHHASLYCHKEAANTHKSHKSTTEIYFPPCTTSPWQHSGRNKAQRLLAPLHYIICWRDPRGRGESRSICCLFSA